MLHRIAMLLPLLLACSAPSTRPEALLPETPAVEAPEGYAYVPPGTFMLGSPPGDPTARDNERQVEVTLTVPLFMKTTEITQAEWEAVMGDNPSHFSDCSECPVEGVSFYDSLVFLNAMSEAEGLPPCYLLDACEGLEPRGCNIPENHKRRLSCWVDHGCERIGFAGLECAGYRLPTEAEWEYAARGGRAFISLGKTESRGEDCAFADPKTDAVAWTCSNAHGRPQVVGLLEPNPWGLFDMRGNVSEWVWATFSSYPEAPATNPMSVNGGNRVVSRGGHFASDALAAYPTRREVRRLRARDARIGLRPVRAVPASEATTAEIDMLRARLELEPCSVTRDGSTTAFRYEVVGPIRLPDYTGPETPQLVVRTTPDGHRTGLLYLTSAITVTIGGSFSIDHDASRELRGLPVYSRTDFDAREEIWVEPGELRPLYRDRLCDGCEDRILKRVFEEDTLVSESWYPSWNEDASSTLTVLTRDTDGQPLTGELNDGLTVHQVKLEYDARGRRTSITTLAPDGTQHQERLDYSCWD